MACGVDQITRHAVLPNLIKNLSSPSLFSKTYCPFSTDEATDIGKVIEEEAYYAALAFAKSGSADDDGGMGMLNAYTKEISRRASKAKEDQKVRDEEAKRLVVYSDEERVFPHSEASTSVDQHQNHDGDEEAKRFAVGFLDLQTRNNAFKEIMKLLSSLPSPALEKYSTLPFTIDEATAIAKTIEEEAFSLAQSGSGGDDEGEDKFVYLEEVRKRMFSAQSRSGDNDEHARLAHKILYVYLQEVTRRMFKVSRAKADMQDNRSVVLTDGAQVNATSALSPSKWSSLDRSIPYVSWRWLVAFALFAIFVLRIYYLRRFVYVCYQFGFLFMIKFPAFLSPVDVKWVPKSSSGEFKPFIRLCPEYEFWQHVMFSLCITFPMTFVDFFDIPIPWFIALLVWVLTSVGLLKTPIKRMVKLGYVPFNFRKQTYGKKPASSNGALED